MKKELLEDVGKITVLLLITCGVALILVLPTMWLWNWLMPTIFGLVKIGFWQALGLNLLAGIFFKHNNGMKKE